MNITEHTLHLPIHNAYNVFVEHDYDIVDDLQACFRRVGELRMRGYAATVKRINGKPIAVTYISSQGGAA